MTRRGKEETARKGQGPRGHIGRRTFLAAGAAGLGAGALAAGAKRSSAEQAGALYLLRGAQDLTVQPVLTYEVPKRRPARSWRNWGNVHTQEAARLEAAEIEKELKALAANCGFGLKVKPVLLVSGPAQAEAVKSSGADAVLLYAAGGWTNLLGAVMGATSAPVVVFLRYKSGPYYLWHEIVHARFLRAHTDHLKEERVTVEDVVVDDLDELKWRLRALYGLRNVLGRKIICVGGPGGWAAPKAPELARKRFGLEMITVSIPEINSMIEAGRKDKGLMERCTKAADSYINAPGVTLKTTRKAVIEAFLLKELFLRLMEKHGAYAVTVRGCMGSYAGIMPCLTLTLVNDSGYMAYCEGDFVVIPAGMLLHFICGKPTYFCNPTFPQNGRMMFAHCTAPRRMSGEKLEPVELVTHYESDHGAATHVLFPKGQLLTIIKPDFEASRWLALTGTITDTPFLATCRAQVEVKLHAPTEEVVRNLRGFHCMLAYGDYTREVTYAAAKVGISVQVLKT